jgi:NADH-quinone oxidoreductase subunit M
MDIKVTLWSVTTTFPLLSTLMLVPLATMLFIMFSRSSAVALRFGIAGTLLTLFLSTYLLAIFDPDKPGIQLFEEINFAGLSYSVGVDGSNILFILLTPVLTLLALVYTLIVRPVSIRLYVSCLLGYETILIGAFSALNAMQFWLWCFLELIPVVLLTIHAGTGLNRRPVIAVLLQYWVSGLLMTLFGFIFLAFGYMNSGHVLTFDWLTLTQNNAYLQNEVIIFILLFFGFAVRLPLFPFHGWFPLLAEHGTVATIPIFIVGLKLGIYALIRFVLPIVPDVAEHWDGLVLTLSLISIFYGALLALMQINIRRLLAFAVISHTGMLVIGVFDSNYHGWEGSIMLSIAYGLAAAGMLFSIGMIYERTRTAFIPRLGGQLDTNTTVAVMFVISALSTMAMPGTPGFDGAHLLIEGTIDKYGWFTAAAILIGNVLAAALLLRAFQLIFVSASKRAQQPFGSAHHSVKGERIITAVVCSLLIVTGFYTTPWARIIDQGVLVSSTEPHPIHRIQKSGALTSPIDTKDNQDE